MLKIHKKLARDKALFDYPTTERIFNEHREATRGRDLDITGLSYKLPEKKGPQQWPFRDSHLESQKRLYTDGAFQTGNGKAKFTNATYQPTADVTNVRQPRHLLTGRLRNQWHGMSRTGTIAQLYDHVEEPLLSMNEDDMQRRQLKDGDIVKLSNKRGELNIRIQKYDEVKTAQTFLPMHWGRQFMNGLGANAPMPADVDKTSKQPELKHTAVRVEKLDLPWQMTVMRTCHDLSLISQIRALLKHFDYTICGLYGREQSVVVLRASHIEQPNTEVIAQLDDLLDMMEGAPMLSYDDAKRSVSKRILVEDGQVTAVRLIGETLAAD